jgi:hypothetical protein
MLEHDLELMALPGAVDSATNVLRAMCHPVRGAPRSVMIRDELVDLKVPTPLLVGNQGQLPAVRRGATSLRARGRCQPARRRGWRSPPHFEAPDLVANAITEFLHSSE